MKETLWIDGNCIIYQLVRKKVKNISLRIKPDMTIIITAGLNVSKKNIEDFIIRKYDWIKKHLYRMENFEKISSEEIKLEDGEIIRLLGLQLILRILPSKENSIQMNKENIYINTIDIKDKNAIKHLWVKWYESFIKLNLIEIMDVMYPVFREFHVNKPKVKLRYMKTRWGTCNARTDTITLNKYLIQVPIECIEYVVVHEYTHFLHPNHSKDFYNTLRIIMPDYKEREKLLGNYMILS